MPRKKKEIESAPSATPSYNPVGKEKEVQEKLDKRVSELKEARKRPLIGTSRSIEDIWRDADREYTPHELGFDKTDRKRLETQEDGLSSRRVHIGQDDDWQSRQADPIFYTKVNTAMSVLVDQNPEAVFMADSSKYEANTKLAYSNWKHSWEVSGAKQQIKNFIFNDAKYGFAPAKTYPKIIKMKKRVLTKYYEDDPEKNQYEEKTLVKYNDLCRRALNPWQVWVSEMARPGDRLSIDDWYYEEDYSWDKFQAEFSEFNNVSFVTKGAHESTGEQDVQGETGHKDMVTVGFYENQVTDQFVIWIPSQKIVLHESPMPNDDGLLSLWFAPWTLRDDRSIYGIGLYEILRNDSILYNRFKNMTMDQLTLSIYKMFFYKGLNTLGENGKLVVSPGAGEQVLDPKDVTFMEVPGPGNDAFHGMQFLQDRIDSNSGVPQQLSGKFAGKTLGQDIEAKNAALDRMKTPLDYILDALQEEAYISISWQKQILSTPEVLEWNNEEDLIASLKEAGLQDSEIQEYMSEAAKPDNELVGQEDTGEVDETGNPVMKKLANVYKEIPLSMEKDEKGELIESEDSRFYRFGVHLPTKSLEWRGIVRVKPQSILAPSKDLVKRMKLDLFNLVYPAIQGMLASPASIPILLPPIKQVLKAFEEEAKNWFDEKTLQKMAEAASQPKDTSLEAKISLSVKFEDFSTPLTPTQKQITEKYLGIKIEDPLFIQAGSTPQAEASLSVEKQAPEISEQSPASQPSSGNAEQIQPLAQLGEAPSTLGGAVQGANQV